MSNLANRRKTQQDNVFPGMECLVSFAEDKQVAEIHQV
jgi:hypothetical protein